MNSIELQVLLPSKLAMDVVLCAFHAAKKSPEIQTMMIRAHKLKSIEFKYNMNCMKEVRSNSPTHTHTHFHIQRDLWHERCQRLEHFD